VAIHAPSLEKVLTILDARHLVGEFHPAIALKARIEKLEGINSGILFFITLVFCCTEVLYCTTVKR
jgi:hypothetical protein